MDGEWLRDILFFTLIALGLLLLVIGTLKTFELGVALICLGIAAIVIALVLATWRV